MGRSVEVTTDEKILTRLRAAFDRQMAAVEEHAELQQLLCLQVEAARREAEKLIDADGMDVIDRHRQAHSSGKKRNHKGGGHGQKRPVYALSLLIEGKDGAEALVSCFAHVSQKSNPDTKSDVLAVAAQELEKIRGLMPGRYANPRVVAFHTNDPFVKDRGVRMPQLSCDVA